MQEIIVFLSLIGAVQSLRLNHPVPTDKGHDYLWVWKIFIILGSIGMIYNSLTISMMLLIKNKKRFSFFTLNLCINISDLLFDIYAFILGILHLYYGVEFTGFSCFIESIIELVLQVWIMNILVGISWVVRSDICYGKAVSQSAMLLYSVLSLAYCIVIAFIATWFGGYKLDSSGTYCFVDISSVFAIVFYSLCTVTIPRIFMIYNLRITNKIIVAAQKELDAHGIQEQAKANYIRMVKKLNIFVIVTMTSFFPVTAAAIYEWVTNQYIPPAFSIFIQINVTLVSCIGNPTLFFYLNVELRRVLWGCIMRLFQHLSLIPICKRLLKSENQLYSKPTLQSVLKDIRYSLTQVSNHSIQLTWNKLSKVSDIESSSLDRKYYYDIKNWMSDPNLFKAFKEVGRRDYALENFLFYEDAQIYQNIGKSILLRINSLYSSGHVVSSPYYENHLENLISDWEDLEKCGLRMYNLYIKIPTSPLEINIPYDKKLAIINIFRVTDRTPTVSTKLHAIAPDASTCDEINSFTDRAFPSLRTLIDKGPQSTIEKIGKYINVFDASVQIIMEIIETDIWSRFIVSEFFYQTISEHSNVSNPNYNIANKVITPKKSIKSLNCKSIRVDRNLQNES